VESNFAEVPLNLLSQVKAKVQKLEKFDEIWRSSGIASKNKVSIWDGRLRSKKLGVAYRNRRRVCLGHFASGSYTAPRGDRYIIELTDMSVSGMQQSKWLDSVVHQYFPHPQRFHRVWGIQTGSAPVFIWQPIPPSADFIALGMIATKSEDSPSVRSVHCVPLAWVEAAPELCKMLWGDAGTGGKAGSLWSVGSLQLLAAAQGQTPPTEAAFKLKQTRFTLGDPQMRVAGINRTGTPGGSEIRFRASTPNVSDGPGVGFVASEVLENLPGLTIPSPPMSAVPSAKEGSSTSRSAARSDGRVHTSLQNTSL